jgi:signal transduction histidine kinase
MGFQIVLPEYKIFFGYIFAPISIFLFIVVCLFIQNLYKNRVFIYYRFLYIGSFLFLIFNTLGLFFNSPDKNFYGLTNFSILCIGWFLELMMFMLALCMKAKNDWDEKLSTIEKNTTIEKKLLLQEMERQQVIHESKQTERLKISNDIHDGISNTISGLKFYINDKRLQTQNLKEKEFLKDLESEINSIYIQVRDYIQKLYSGDHEDNYDILYFLDALQQHYKTSSLQIFINIDRIHINKYLTKYQAKEFYFILNEIIGNSIKHSKCDEISIQIGFDETVCNFSIQDNGKGFDYDISRNKGLGLSIIQNRINKLQGEIKYSILNGTKVRGYFPYSYPPKEGG